MRKNKKWAAGFTLTTAVLCIFIMVIYFIYRDGKAYHMNYHIQPVFSGENSLQVSLKITNLHLAGGGYLEFGSGDMQISDIRCKDDKGTSIPVQSEEGLLRIPVGDRRTVELSYTAKIGSLGKHGHRGGVYEDLIVFDGGAVFLFPVQAFNSSDEEIRKSIGSISISSDAPEGWIKAGPFEKISHPAWSQFNILKDTCFALGQLQKKEYKKGKGSFFVYTDAKSKFPFNAEAEKGLNALYDYYASLFGYDVPGFSIVLLRSNPRDDVYMIGGASAKSIGTTFNPDNPRDWELMGHRLFHAFFDTGVGSRAFHEPPQLWFYEGLATYYENTSMGSLPDSLKKRLALEPHGLFNLLFKKYVYMKLKDPTLLSLAPMNEGKIIQSPGRTEFLHYTQAPLVIKAMEDVSYTQTKKRDAMLKYILENRPREASLTLKSIAGVALKGKSEEFTQRYLLSDEVLPLWYLGTGGEENRADVIKGLNSIEYELWSWFRLECQGYPMDELSEETVKQISNMEKVKDIHFAEESVEEKIRDLSPTVYDLLKEYAIRAKVCGVDFDDPLIRIKLLSDESKVDEWKRWISANR